MMEALRNPSRYDDPRNVIDLRSNHRVYQHGEFFLDVADFVLKSDKEPDGGKYDRILCGPGITTIELGKLADLNDGIICIFTDNEDEINDIKDEVISFSPFYVLDCETTIGRCIMTNVRWLWDI